MTHPVTSSQTPFLTKIVPDAFPPIPTPSFYKSYISSFYLFFFISLFQVELFVTSLIA